MAMRGGENGHNFMKKFLALGIAVIPYDGIAETDFTKIALDKARPMGEA